MSNKTVEFTIASVKQGRRLYGAGLKHRMLTLPLDPELAQGDRITVALTLALTHDTFPLPARVVHCGGTATIVQMDSVPAKVYAVIGEIPPPSPPVDSMTETVEVSPAEVGIAPTAEPSSEPKLAPEAAAVAPGATGSHTPPEGSPAEEPVVPPKRTVADPSAVGGEGTAPPRRVPAKAPAPAPADGPGKSGPSFKLKGPKAPGRRPTAAATAAPPSSPGAGAQARAAADPDTALPVPGKPGVVVDATPARKGELGEVGMPDVFMDLLKEGATGVLVVDGYKERYWGFFIEGRPHRFTREPPTRAESLEFHFSKAALLEPAAFERVREQADLLSLPLDEILLRRRLLTREQVDGVLQSCATQVTERLMVVNFGRYRFFPMDDVAELVPGRAADVMNVLWERTRAKFGGRNEKQVKQLLEQYHQHHVLITDHGRALVPELRMRGREQIVVERYLRGGWQISELIGRIEVPRRDLLEVLFTLDALGLVSLSEREGENWRLARAERFLVDREDYMHKNAFAFVESHWTGLESELTAACDKVEKKLLDPVLDELELAEVGAIRDAIRARLVEVRAVFSDEEQRREYRGTLVEKAKCRMAAELFLRQGEMALFKGEGVLARECFERVLEVDPGGGQSTLRLARAKRVLQDLGRGILTQAAELDGDEDVMDVSPEDLDDM